MGRLAQTLGLATEQFSYPSLAKYKKITTALATISNATLRRTANLNKVERDPQLKLSALKKN